MKPILVLGGVSYNTMIYLDSLPAARPQTIFSQGSHETVGSTGAGKALNLYRLGRDVRLHALIGDDRYGQRIKAYFSDAGLPFVYDLDPLGTKRHVNLMDNQGDRISIFLNPGSSDPTVNHVQVEQLISASSIVALNIINYTRQFIPIIQHHGKPIWCDIHDYDGQDPYHQEFIEAADAIFMSSDRMHDTRPFMESLIAQGKKFVICTHGTEGATALTTAGQWLEISILDHYRRQDSNGAGDAFFAGVLYGYSRGYELLYCLQLGTVVSGLCVTSNELALHDMTEAMLLKQHKKHYPPGLPAS